MKRLKDGIIIANVDVNMDYDYGICVMWLLSVNDDGIFLDDFVRRGKLVYLDIVLDGY